MTPPNATTTARDIRRDERIANIRRLVPSVEREPKGVTAFALSRRSGMTIQQVLGALEVLVKCGDVQRVKIGTSDTGARYMRKPQPVGPRDPRAPLDPVALYRLEREKRRAANAGMDVDEWRRRYGHSDPASDEQIATARKLLEQETERRHYKRRAGSTGSDG